MKLLKFSFLGFKLSAFKWKSSCQLNLVNRIIRERLHIKRKGEWVNAVVKPTMLGRWTEKAESSSIASPSDPWSHRSMLTWHLITLGECPKALIILILVSPPSLIDSWYLDTLNQGYAPGSLRKSSIPHPFASANQRISCERRSSLPFLSLIIGRRRHRIMLEEGKMLLISIRKGRKNWTKNVCKESTFSHLNQYNR